MHVALDLHPLIKIIIIITIFLVTNNEGEWTVGDTLNTNGMNNEEYKSISSNYS